MIHYTALVFWVTSRIPGLPSAEAPKVGEKMDIEGAFQDPFTPGTWWDFIDLFGLKNVVHLCSFKAHMGMGQNPGTPGEPQNSW